jgi:hypothetical protein
MTGPQVADIQVRPGAMVAIALTYEGLNGGAPPSLVGATAEMQVRATPDNGTVLAEADVEVDDAAHTITLTLSAASTATMARGGVYDVLVTFADAPDDPVCPLRGRVALVPGVTRG